MCAVFLRRVRAFLDSRGFTEVTTDSLVPAGAFEGTIDPLEVRFKGGSAELHTSPEIEMKRMISATLLPLYQICKCYRDDPPTGIHLREFTMLEFYRVNADYQPIMSDVRDLMNELAGRKLAFEEISVRDLVLRYTGIDLDRAVDATSLRREIESRQLLSLAADDAWDDLFFKLMIERVEPALPPETPVLVKDYPLPLGALAKRSPTGSTVERFEIYWYGMELCNGCTELEDVEELKARFEREQAGRRAQGKTAHPFPQRLLDAMQNDFPSCAGVAVGVNRLFWALEKAGLL
jgi:lysyl-tRNA synthetase class 2